MLQPRITQLPRVLALAVVALGLLLPLAAMLGRSFLVYEVTRADGRVFRAAGDVDIQAADVRFELPPDPEGRRTQVSLPKEDVASVDRVVSFDHYAKVFGSSRTLGLLKHSLWMSLGGALVALLMGLPVAWVLARVRLPGLPIFGVLMMAPAILPPFFIALGGARTTQHALIALFDVQGGTLQILNASFVFGCVLFPFVVAFVGPALAAVPAGPAEAARLLGGRRAALRHVIWPAVRPSIIGAFVLCVVLSITDFAVPDLLGFMLPAGEQPAHVFSTEIRLAWEKNRNYGHAVATGSPFLLVTIALVGVALACLRRSPVLGTGDAGRRRPRLPLRSGPALAGLALLVLVYIVSLGMPLSNIASWAQAGETIKAGTNAEQELVRNSGSLFEFGKALDSTPKIRPQRTRWLKMAGGAALLAMVLGAILARAAVRGGRRWRTFVLLIAALPLAVPGIVLSLGTILLWKEMDVAIVQRGLLQPILVLAMRFLPFAILASWLALREVRPGHEQAAVLLGAGPRTTALRIWGPLGLRGIVVGGLLVLILALREFESVMLIEPRIYLARLYEKIHFSRLADEANLLFLYILYVLGPALCVALLLGFRGRRGRSP